MVMFHAPTIAQVQHLIADAEFKIRESS